MTSLSGTYIVSGGASGLGRACVRSIAQAGGHAVAFDVNEPSDGEFERIDITDGDAVAQRTNAVAARHGGLNGIVANAGIDACGPFGSIEAKAWERVIAVNLFGVATLVRAALPHLERSHGRVVTVASTLGLRALADATAYCASKFAVVGFTRALTLELADRVGVTLLVPGGMHTAFFDGRTPQYKPAAGAKLNSPDNVAGAIVFALSQPSGCEVRELIVTPSTETSWP